MYEYPAYVTPYRPYRKPYPRLQQHRTFPSAGIDDLPEQYTDSHHSDPNEAEGIFSLSII